MPVAVDRLFGFDSPSQLMTEAIWQRLWMLVQGTGVYLESDSSLKVVPNTPPSMSVVVQPGAAWVGGVWCEVQANKTLPIAAPPSSGARIDRVVLRRNNATNAVELGIVQGQPASSPTPPALNRSGDIYEVSLAQVRVAAGATSIAAADITDERQDRSVCGTLAVGQPRTILVGTLAARPAAGTADRFYWASDTGQLFRDTGTAWQEVMPGANHASRHAPGGADDISANYLSKAGDTMTGPLTLAGDPTASLHAATKQYVDAKVAAGGPSSLLFFGLRFGL